MIGPVTAWSEFGDFAPMVVDRREEPIPTDDELKQAAAAAMAERNLDWRPEQMLGRSLVLLQGASKPPSYLRRSRIYTLARPHEMVDAVREHVALIARLHGPGRVWFLGEPGMVMPDTVAFGEVPALRGALPDGTRDVHIAQVSYYGHEAQATTRSVPNLYLGERS